jgi:hypothetical protein
MDNSKPKVERSVDPAMPENVRKIEGIEGLEDVPHSIIPVPYYTLVQPESTNAFLPDGKRAPDGVFLMQDSRKTTSSIDFVILRAKRQTRMIDNGFGGEDKVVSLNVLGLNLDRMKPFIINVSVTSFSAFGKFFDYLSDQKATKAWEYAVTATVEEADGKKQTSEGLKHVTWYVVRLSVGKKTNKSTMAVAERMYGDYGHKLDFNESNEDLESMAGKVSSSESNKNE